MTDQSRRTSRGKSSQIQNVKTELICGLFSKKDAAKMIAEGARHIHSSILGQNDGCVKVTAAMLGRRKSFPYPWEILTPTAEIDVTSSRERHGLISKAAAAMKLETKRALAEKMGSVLEELATNAIYHAYYWPDGQPKYRRRQTVELDESETVSLRYAASDHGIYLRVADRGGHLDFKKISEAFARCYLSSNQIQAKESGAGLGLYMIFESVTHLRIDVTRGQQTILSCWLPEKRHFDPDTFSFNFFEWGKAHAAK